MVLVHGAMDRSAGMLKLARQIDDRCRVVRYDRRGYGRSVGHDGRHPGPITIAAHVDDLATLLDGRRAIIVGHSFGGNVALAFAARFARQTVAVVTYESPLSWLEWWPQPPFAEHADLSANPDEGMAGDIAEAFMRRMLGDKVWERMPAATRLTRRLEGSTFVAEMFDARTNQPWQASDIQAPVVFGHGEQAVDLHVRGAAELLRLFPAARFERLEGAGHGAPLSHAALFADRLLKPLLASDLEW